MQTFFRQAGSSGRTDRYAYNANDASPTLTARSILVDMEPKVCPTPPFAALPLIAISAQNNLVDCSLRHSVDNCDRSYNPSFKEQALVYTDGDIMPKEACGSKAAPETTGEIPALSYL
eukprot:6717830-Pyramimonas_sp.AAC.1